VRLFAGLAVFLVAIDGGGYSLESRGTVAIAVWWAVLVGFASGVLPWARASAAAVVAGGCLAALAALAFASMAWAASDERAFAEADRILLYLGAFVLAASSPGRWRAALADGLGAGCAAVGALALASRCFPDLISGGQLADFLPSASARLSYPVGYWNGLAVLAALGVPLLLRGGVAGASPALRALALAPVPALAAVVYLASSRGAAAAAVIGALAFCVLERRRWAAVGAVLVAGAGSAAAIAALVSRSELVDGPLGSDAAVEQGRGAAVLLVLVCAATGLVHALGVRFLSRARPPRALAWAAAGALVALALVAVVAAEPVEAFRTFKEPPGAFSEPRPDLVRAHLLSGGGSGRWQFWEAAVDEFRSRPLAGHGAGSYEAWWAQHGSLAYFVRDAHSLYLELLGELGLLGLGLLLGAFAAGLAGLRALRALGEGTRSAVAALAAAFLAYAFAAGIDWMWETTVVSLVGMACLGLLVARDAPRARVGVPVRAAVAFVALAVLVLQALPLLGALELDESRAAVRGGDLAEARIHARRARDLQPWAATPYLQLALVAEEAGDLAIARTRIRDALRRDASDWRLWLVAARLDTKAGDVAAARRSLARAVALNPRSPLFANSP
jgi:tetratricopeptide (TPR) repeat protein